MQLDEQPPVLDPITAAEILIGTQDDPLVVTGLAEGARVEVPPGHSIELPAGRKRSRPRPTIFVPRGPNPPIRAELAGGRLSAVAPEMLAALSPGEPIALELEDVMELDARALSAPAEQAVREQRPLVIVVRRG